MEPRLYPTSPLRQHHRFRNTDTNVGMRWYSSLFLVRVWIHRVKEIDQCFEFTSMVDFCLNYSLSLEQSNHSHTYVSPLLYQSSVQSYYDQYSVKYGVVLALIMLDSITRSTAGIHQNSLIDGHPPLQVRLKPSTPCLWLMPIIGALSRFSAHTRIYPPPPLSSLACGL